MKEPQKTPKIVYIQANRTVTNEDGHVTIQLHDVTAITHLNESFHLHPTNPDKFVITSDDYATANTELWSRLKIYFQRRFQRSYIPVKLTSNE